MNKNRMQLVALEEQAEMESRRRLLAQARKGNVAAQKTLWQVYHVRLTPGKDVSPDIVARVRTWMRSAEL